MELATRVSKVFIIVFALFLLVRVVFISNVEMAHSGVRVSNASGVLERDLGPGWQMQVPGLQRIIQLPAKYLFLNYNGEQALEIRTKDNNIVTIDISVPYRIVPGEAYEVVMAGNHVEDQTGTFRFQRLMHETTVSVLRENLAELQSSDFYNTDRRIEVASHTLEILNEKLEPLHLEATDVLLRASYFRSEYEQQLARIQLNEQNKLLDGARQKVAEKQQLLDNYLQQTNALQSAKEQDWSRRIAEMERSYNVGFLETSEDETPGAARRTLEALPEEDKGALVNKAAVVLEREPDDVIDAYLLGIKNIQAETLEYNNRVRAAADGISARLSAEGNAQVAEVNGAYESRINDLLGSPAGRAFVAFQAAGHIQFAETLTFQSGDGIPSVLRLRDFARSFMGG